MGSIVVSNVGKAYKQYPNRWARLADWLIPGSRARYQLRWVLKNINFSIAPGESVGIVGINGAGKSTLLKIITGTTQPTFGGVQVDGRVAALLELGMGFHPDFTGRQNALMAGQLMGVSASEIDHLMPEIEAFAEIGSYIDREVRSYSSGMQLRLAFAVATVKRPDVLIIDEALAVGDAYFQHKCSEKIRSYRDAGTTLLFVSHSASAVKALCSRAILLADGEAIRDGHPEEVVDYYNALIAKKTDAYSIQTARNLDGRLSTASGTGCAVIENAEFLVSGRKSTTVQVGELVEIVLKVKALVDLRSMHIGVLIRDRWGSDVWGTNTFHHDIATPDLSAGQSISIRFKIAPFILAPGNYSISAALHSGVDHLTENYCRRDRILTFQVMQGQHKHCVGVCSLPVELGFLTE